jgi:hypothetical protein
MQYVIDPLIVERGKHRLQINDWNEDLLGYLVYGHFSVALFWFEDRNGIYQGKLIPTGNGKRREIQGPQKHEWRGEIGQTFCESGTKRDSLNPHMLYSYVQNPPLIAMTDAVTFQERNRYARYKQFISNGLNVMAPDRSVIATISGDIKGRCRVELHTKNVDQLLLLSFIVFIVYGFH